MGQSRNRGSFPKKKVNMGKLREMAVIWKLKELTWYLHNRKICIYVALIKKCRPSGPHGWPTILIFKASNTYSLESV